MRVNDFNLSAKIIKETFDDESTVISSVKAGDLNIDCNIHDEDDVFITSDGGFIFLEFQQENFTEEELAKYIALAEETYEKYGQKISIYILCPKNIDVCVREFEILSDATFTIKIACIDEDPCRIILNEIKDKIRDDQMLDKEDIEKLSKLRRWCKKEDRNYYLLEYVTIVNRLHY